MRGRTDSLIADIDTVERDASSAAITSPERYGRKTVLRRIEIASVLNLHAGLELRQIKKVASIKRKVLNLLCSQNSLDRRLLGVYRDTRRLHFNDLRFLSHFGREVPGGDFAHLHRHGCFNRGKTFALYAHRIGAWRQRSGNVRTSGIRGYDQRLAGSLASDCDLRPGNHGSRWISDSSLNASG